MLKLHNSLTGRKEVFTPITPGQVRLYVCGMTVYDYCHLGHARAMVVFDTVARYLRASGYALEYVRNITDIDDKIIRRATETQTSMDALTQRFTQAMHEDADALGCLRPDAEPRATQHMPEIIAMIEQLVANGYAYASGGDVYYAVAQFADYGALSGRRLEDLRAGARIEPGEHKRDPADFVLWKAARAGEPYWPSPWGDGRPGWHIECSAMSTHCLGHHFDIHGGGLDLQFPHHENEIAQSEAATGEHFVNYWMHNGHVRIDDEKMAKSLGNFTTVRAILDQFDAETVRYFLLSSHYRSPLNYTDQALEAARAGLERLYRALRGVVAPATPTVAAELNHEHGSAEALMGRFRAAMDDDFNTPLALSVLFEMARVLNRAREQGDAQAIALYAERLTQAGQLLGLLRAEPEVFLKGGAQDDQACAARIEALVAERTEARAKRDFARADAIRDQLLGEGIVLEDQANATIWRREG